MLGIDIVKDHIIQANFNDVIAKAQSTMQLWKSKNLTLLGKINIVNTLVDSLFMHKMQVMPELL